MELVIKIPEEKYKHIMKMQFYTPRGSLIEEMLTTIRNGTPLPKGHGRIGDLDKVADRLEALRDNWNYYGNEYENGVYTGYEYSLDGVMDAPTIIEADTESEEKE